MTEIKTFITELLYDCYDSIYLWMPYKKQAKPGAASVTQGPWTGNQKKTKNKKNTLKRLNPKITICISIYS